MKLIRHNKLDITTLRLTNLTEANGLGDYLTHDVWEYVQERMQNDLSNGDWYEYCGDVLQVAVIDRARLNSDLATDIYANLRKMRPLEFLVAAVVLHVVCGLSVAEIEQKRGGNAHQEIEQLLNTCADKLDGMRNDLIEIIQEWIELNFYYGLLYEGGEADSADLEMLRDLLISYESMRDKDAIVDQLQLFAYLKSVSPDLYMRFNPYQGKTTQQILTDMLAKAPFAFTNTLFLAIYCLELIDKGAIAFQVSSPVTIDSTAIPLDLIY